MCIPKIKILASFLVDTDKSSAADREVRSAVETYGDRGKPPIRLHLLTDQNLTLIRCTMNARNLQITCDGTNADLCALADVSNESVEAMLLLSNLLAEGESVVPRDIFFRQPCGSPSIRGVRVAVEWIAVYLAPGITLETR